MTILTSQEEAKPSAWSAISSQSVDLAQKKCLHLRNIIHIHNDDGNNILTNHRPASPSPLKIVCRALRTWRRCCY